MHDARLFRLLLFVLPAFVLIVLALWLTPATFAAPPRLPATIQAQVEAAPDGGSILILAGTYNESVTINKSLTVTAVSSATTIIQAVSGQRAINVTAGHTVTLKNLTITGGNPVSGVGGGVYIDAGGDLRIVNCRINGNSADYGGGVFAAGATNRVDVVGSRIEQNAATYHGGGLYVNGSVALTDTQVLTNVAGFHGGGLHTQDGRTDLAGGLFAYNRANGGNGGAANANNAIAVSGTQFISNTAAQDGGALLQWNAGQPVLVTNARFENNASRLEGGGLRASGDLTVTSAVFISNAVDSLSTTNTHGGGIYLNGGALNVVSSTFTSNSTRCSLCPSMEGGAIHLVTGRAAVVQGSQFYSNTAWSGGAIGVDLSGTLSIRYSGFYSNVAGYGGALTPVNADIQDTVFAGNRAVNRGGAIDGGLYNLSGLVTMRRVQFLDNAATFEGAGAMSTVGALDAANVLFAGNRSTVGPAVLSFAQAYTRTLRHVTLAYPGQGAGAAIRLTGGTLNITNSIVASYSIGISNTGAIVSADYDLFFGGAPAQTSGGTTILGPNNLTADPRFVNPAAGDYHLRAVSPAIGAGTDVGVALDLDGRPRVNRFDLGAYQFWTSLFLPLIRR